MHRVYIYDDMAAFTDADMVKAYTLVTPGRLKKARSMAYADGRKQSVVAELLLRHALRDGCGLESLPPIEETANGKPRFKGSETLPRFNLSHCTEAVACAVAIGDGVGVDVEPYSSYSADVAAEVLSADELSFCSGRPALFAELWTKKESYLKLAGTGLCDSLQSLLDDIPDGMTFHTYHNPRRGYACTVCSHSVTHIPLTMVDKTSLLDG